MNSSSRSKIFKYKGEIRFAFFAYITRILAEGHLMCRDKLYFSVYRVAIDSLAVEEAGMMDKKWVG